MSTLDQPPPNCPICGTPCTRPPKASYTAEQAAAHWVPAIRDPERHDRLVRCIQRLWKQDTTEIFFCPSPGCGYGFGWPLVGGDEEFYEIMHAQAAYNAWRWEFDLTVERMHKRWPGGGRVLDIGAGDGPFLVQMGPKWQQYALESTEFMRKILEGKGVTVWRDLEAAARDAAGTFQVVAIFHTLHQICDFGPVLDAARKLLAPDGVLVVSHPDGDQMIRWQKATKYEDMPPGQIHKFNGRSIALALNRHGFKVDESIVQPPRWGRVQYTLYLRVRSDAANRPRSLAAQAYRIRDRKKREWALRLVGLLYSWKILPHLNVARLSNNIVTYAHKA